MQEQTNYAQHSSNETESLSILRRINNWADERGLIDIDFLKDKQTSFITEEVTELLAANSPEDYVDAFADIIVFATNAIRVLGYDPDIALEETLKEISSRKGAFNPDTSKWEKFKDAHHQSLWYKANYTIAKIG